MAPAYSKLVTRSNVCAASAVAAAAIWLISRRRRGSPTTAPLRPKKKQQSEEEIVYVITEKADQRPKAHVDAAFFRQLRKLLHIAVPGWSSPEAGLLVLIAGSLVARSLCDLWLINNATDLEIAIVSANMQRFRAKLVQFLAAMPCVAMVNNVMKWSIGELQLKLRSNMTHNLYNDYLKSFTYYRMSNLDNRISNADQLLTTDVDKFCTSLTDLYSNVAKPMLDIGIYVYRLTANLGGSTPTVLLTYLGFAGVLLTYLRRPTGRMTVVEQKLEGEFRHINARLITHSEEVAFYNGNNREKMTIIASYNKLLQHLRKFLKFRVVMGVIDNIVAKYFATVVGFISVSLPFMSSKHPFAKLNSNERYRSYYSYGRMMVKLAEAIGRLVLAGRELTRLAGFTARMTQLKAVLDDLNKGQYSRTMVAGSSMTTANGSSEGLRPGAGRLIFENNIIRFDKVPLITPNGDVLIEELSFEVQSGTNVLVCGPNGCGKSSLFRVLGELWPLFGGTLVKPPRGKLFYIPQRPYMTLGPLRDQLTYPHSHAEAVRRGCSDQALLDHLNRVQLGYLLDREGGLDAVADWLDVLSGGEKQRVAMARLFYHAPQFAILDECTSAVSVDVEGSMYQYCREVGITLFTVSHRRSLWVHHEHVLQFDGRGNYSFQPISPDMDQFGSPFIVRNAGHITDQWR